MITVRQALTQTGARWLEAFGLRAAAGSVSASSATGLDLKGPDGLGYLYGVVDGIQVNVMPPNGGMMGTASDPVDFTVYVGGDEVGRTPNAASIPAMVYDAIDELKKREVY